MVGSNPLKKIQIGHIFKDDHKTDVLSKLASLVTPESVGPFIFGMLAEPSTKSRKIRSVDPSRVG